MDKKSITAIITFLKDEFQKKGVELRGIALFGSQLTESSNPGSANEITPTVKQTNTLFVLIENRVMF